MGKKPKPAKVKFDTSFNFGANATPKKSRTAKSSRKGKWSKYGS